jgi:hypothetical protein
LELALAVGLAASTAVETMALGGVVVGSCVGCNGPAEKRLVGGHICVVVRLEAQQLLLLLLLLLLLWRLVRRWQRWSIPR